MPLYPSKTINIPGIFLTTFVFAIGFFIQCNVATSNIGLRFLNITDMLVLMTLRASLMVRAASPDFLRALAVAAAYELGRALALTARVGYGRRRRGAMA